MKRNIAILMMLVYTSLTFAHFPYLRISPKLLVGEQAVFHIYFGEFGLTPEKGLKWYQGEYLNGFKAFVNIHGENNYSAIELNASEESLSGKFNLPRAGIYQIVAFNEELPVKDLTKYGYGITKRYKYLRVATEATSYKEKQIGNINTQPFMEYDIIPYYSKGGYGNYTSYKPFWYAGEKVYARLFINKKIAVGKEVKIVGPDRWYVIAKTNKKGEFSFTPYRAGQYYAVFKEIKNETGVYKDKEYETKYYNVILTLTVN